MNGKFTCCLQEKYREVEMRLHSNWTVDVFENFNMSVVTNNGLRMYGRLKLSNNAEMFYHIR